VAGGVGGKRCNAALVRRNRYANQTGWTHPAEDEAQLALGSTYRSDNETKSVLAERCRLERWHPEGHLNLQTFQYWRINSLAADERCQSQARITTVNLKGVSVLVG